MANTTWKASERAIAKRLGGERVGNRGRNTEDVAHDWLSVEVKTRKSLPAWLREAMAQAEHNSPAGRLPVVVLHQVVQRHDGDLVVLRLGDFTEYMLGPDQEMPRIANTPGESDDC